MQQPVLEAAAAAQLVASAMTMTTTMMTMTTLFMMVGLQQTLLQHGELAMLLARRAVAAATAAILKLDSQLPRAAM